MSSEAQRRPRPKVTEAIPRPELSVEAWRALAALHELQVEGCPIVERRSGGEMTGLPARITWESVPRLVLAALLDSDDRLYEAELLAAGLVRRVRQRALPALSFRVEMRSRHAELDRRSVAVEVGNWEGRSRVRALAWDSELQVWDDVGDWQMPASDEGGQHGLVAWTLTPAGFALFRQDESPRPQRMPAAALTDAQAAILELLRSGPATGRTLKAHARVENVRKPIGGLRRMGYLIDNPRNGSGYRLIAEPGM